jgi:hypothetical protein
MYKPITLDDSYGVHIELMVLPSLMKAFHSRCAKVERLNVIMMMIEYDLLRYKK